MDDMTGVLRRFHRVLVEEIEDKRPEYLDGPFTVAEIYQDLVPYATHRDRIGIQMNGDYEDALLRLLAGEGGYLHLESEHALRELREELESSNPNTGLYREFAAVDVRLGSTAPAPPAPAAPGITEGGEGTPVVGRVVVDDLFDEPVSVADLAPSGEPVKAGSMEDVEAPAEVAAPGAAPHACPWCRAELPHREHLNFCPFCGTDMHLVPCPGCGEELEPEWRFCISCGTEVPG